MKQSKHFSMVVALMIALTSLLALPALAQEQTPIPAPSLDGRTITVTGNGSASGVPDVAYMELGVEARNMDVSAAFTEVNNTIDGMIAALTEAGVAREDIRTTNLSIYRDSYGQPMPMGEGSEPVNTATYVVTNTVRVTVRNIENVANVVNVAIGAGANQLYGLNFSIEDSAALESEARAQAIEDARARAQELASLTGVTLGEVVRVVEYQGGGFFPYAEMAMGGRGGDGGAVVEPGSLSVSTSIEVTFAING